MILPWTAQANPVDYADIAKIIWEVELAAGETPPLGAWRAAGGAGVWTRGRAAGDAETAAWEEATGGCVWVS